MKENGPITVEYDVSVPCIYPRKEAEFRRGLPPKSRLTYFDFRLDDGVVESCELYDARRAGDYKMPAPTDL